MESQRTDIVNCPSILYIVVMITRNEFHRQITAEFGVELLAEDVVDFCTYKKLQDGGRISH